MNASVDEKRIHLYFVQTTNILTMIRGYHGVL